VEPWNFLARQHGLEENLWASESLTADLNHSLVRHSIGLMIGCARFIEFHFLLVVEGNVAQLLLDVSSDLDLS